MPRRRLNPPHEEERLEREELAMGQLEVEPASILNDKLLRQPRTRAILEALEGERELTTNELVGETRYSRTSVVEVSHELHNRRPALVLVKSDPGRRGSTTYKGTRAGSQALAILRRGRAAAGEVDPEAEERRHAERQLPDPVPGYGQVYGPVIVTTTSSGSEPPRAVEVVVTKHGPHVLLMAIERDPFDPDTPTLLGRLYLQRGTDDRTYGARAPGSYAVATNLWTVDGRNAEVTRMLHERAAAIAASWGLPLASGADLTGQHDAWWWYQAEKGRAEVATSRGQGGYVARRWFLDYPPPASLENPPRRRNADESRRRAERSGDPVEILKQRLRRGEVTHAKIELAARLGDPRASAIAPSLLPEVNWNDWRTRSNLILGAGRLINDPQGLAVAFACDCAEQVLRDFEGSNLGSDPRPRRAIEAARLWLTSRTPAAAFAAAHAAQAASAAAMERVSLSVVRAANSAANAANAAGAHHRTLVPLPVDEAAAQHSASSSSPSGDEERLVAFPLRLAAYVLGEVQIPRPAQTNPGPPMDPRDLFAPFGEGLVLRPTGSSGVHQRGPREAAAMARRAFLEALRRGLDVAGAARVAGMPVQHFTQLAGDDLEVRFAMERSWGRRKNPDDRLRAAERALAAAPEDRAAWVALWRERVRSGRLDDHGHTPRGELELAAWRHPSQGQATDADGVPTIRMHDAPGAGSLPLYQVPAGILWDVAGRRDPESTPARGDVFVQVRPGSLHGLAFVEVAGVSDNGTVSFYRTYPDPHGGPTSVRVHPSGGDRFTTMLRQEGFQPFLIAELRANGLMQPYPNWRSPRDQYAASIGARTNPPPASCRDAALQAVSKDVRYLATHGAPNAQDSREIAEKVGGLGSSCYDETMAGYALGLRRASLSLDAALPAPRRTRWTPTSAQVTAPFGSGLVQSFGPVDAARRWVEESRTKLMAGLAEGWTLEAARQYAGLSTDDVSYLARRGDRHVRAAIQRARKS